MNWVKRSKTGDLGNIRASRQPVSEVEQELAKVKRELAQPQMERDLLKKADHRQKNRNKTPPVSTAKILAE